MSLFPILQVRKQRGQITCIGPQSKETGKLGLNTKRFGSKAHALNDNDTLFPKCELYLYSSTANKTIKEKQKSEIINFLLLRNKLSGILLQWYEHRLIRKVNEETRIFSSQKIQI